MGEEIDSSGAGAPAFDPTAGSLSASDVLFALRNSVNWHTEQGRPHSAGVDADAVRVIKHLQEQDAKWRTWGVIEVMIRNPNVDSFVKEKETEVERLRAKEEAAREMLRALMLVRITVLGSGTMEEWSAINAAIAAAEAAGITPDGKE